MKGFEGVVFYIFFSFPKLPWRKDRTPKCREFEPRQLGGSTFLVPQSG